MRLKQRLPLLLLLVGFLMLCLTPHLYAQNNQTVSGTVTDAQTGNPLIGANILVVGTSNGTATDADGHYSLAVSSLQDSLRFSYIGYQTKTVPIDGRTEIDVELKQKTISGKGLVVTGYGEVRNKISVVGAVQSIKSPTKTLSIPSSSLTNAFGGRLAGVIAFQRSGQPGSNASRFYIRGISTFSGAANPLIIIDGVKSSPSQLNALSPEVIKSFSILKDATATAVYGSRGANGVMIVTTKTGKNLNNPKIHIRLENSINTPTKIPNFVDGVTFMKLFNQAVTGRSSGEVLYTQDQIRGTRLHLNPYIYPNVDWYNRLFKNRSMTQRMNINITGGGDKITYFMSGTFSRANGMLRSINLHSYNNNILVRRYTFQNNLNINASPTSQVTLKLHTKLSYKHGPAESVSSVFGRVMNANPVEYPLMFPSSKLQGVNTILYGGKYGDKNPNPFAEMASGYHDSFQSTVTAVVRFKQDLKNFIKGLSFQGLASFNNWSYKNTIRNQGYNKFKISSYQKMSDGTYNYKIKSIGDIGNLILGTSNSNTGNHSIYLQGRLNYERQIAKKQKISAMLLYNQTNYNINDPTNLISSLPHRSMGYAARVNYSYDNTYLLELDAGYNGSENFAEGHRFGFFPAAAVGYVISNEDFWKPLKSVFNLFKVRASWGEVGNDQIGGQRFVYQSSIDLHGRGYTTGREQNYGLSGPVIHRYANPNITWEVAKKLNIGLDLGLFNKLDFTINFFREKRSNIFLSRNTIPLSMGIQGTTIFANLGAVKNSGIDASLNFSKSFGSNFFMALKGTFTYAHNVVKAMDQPPNEPEYLNPVGHPINSLIGLDAERLFIDQAEIKNSPVQQLGGVVMPGDIKYRDVSGDGKINANDRIFMGYPTVPEMQFGFGPSFKYKNFDLSFLLEGVVHTSFFISGFRPFGTQANRNVLQFIADDHWSRQSPDPFAGYPRLSKNNNPNNTVSSSFWLRDGSFIKLRYVELGYSFRDARVYISGRNLLTFSKFKLWDPEMGGGNGLSYPTQRTFNIGLQLNF